MMDNASVTAAQNASSQPPSIGEGPDRRAGVYPAALSRAGFAILVGPQGHLYSVAWLGPNPHGPDTADLEYLRSSRPSILFALGIQCLAVGPCNHSGTSQRLPS